MNKVKRYGINVILNTRLIRDTDDVIVTIKCEVKSTNSLSKNNTDYEFTDISGDKFVIPIDSVYYIKIYEIK